jgi:hypothetical protein
MAATERKIRLPEGRQLVCDPDVLMVLEFILINIECSKLLKVTDAVHELAGPIFRRYIEEPDFHKDKFIALDLYPQSE